MTHTNIGTIAAAVGKYELNDKTKKRYRNLGVLMRTTAENEPDRYWIRFNADALQPSLFALCARTTMERGDDSIILNVFEPREAKAAAVPIPPGEYENSDEIPF